VMHVQFFLGFFISELDVFGSACQGTGDIIVSLHLFASWV